MVAIAVGEMQGERGAVRLLGIKPSTLRKRMTKLGVPFKFLPQRAAKRQIAPHQLQIGWGFGGFWGTPFAFSYL
jgi:hypothetical protein